MGARLVVWLVVLVVLVVSSPVARAVDVPLEAVPLGAAADDDPVEPMVLTFAPSDPAGLAALLAAQLDAGSPEYRRWLTPEEFAARFGVPSASYDDALAWLVARGFIDVQPFRSRLAVRFRGTAGQAGRAFGAALRAYAWDGETRTAPLGDFVLPSFRGVAPVGLVGPGTFARIVPRVRAGGFTFLAPRDVFKVFALNPVYLAGVTGRGAAIAIPAASDFLIQDVNGTFRNGVPPVTVVKRFVGGSQTLQGGLAQQEVSMDVEWSTAVAPGATALAVIGGGTIDTAIPAALMDAVDGNAAPIVSVSYGVCEPQLVAPFSTMIANLFMQAAAQGQSVLVASGDTGADACGPGTTGASVDGFAASPWVTAVGGTELDPLFDANGDATGYGSERAWNDASGATGGGRSTVVVKPAWQAGPGVPPDGVRDVPDVAFVASPSRPGLAIALEGHVLVAGGTSLGAPVWAGLVALLVEQQGGRLGLLNPELYRLGAAQVAGGAAVFHDVAAGNNTFGGTLGSSAGPGYDLATGWGSFDAEALLAAFAVTPAPCTADAACDDQNPCTQDTCDGARCRSMVLADATTCGFDACSSGVCQGGVCTANGSGSCADDHACTADTCDAGTCRHTPKRGFEAGDCVLARLELPDGPCPGQHLPSRVAIPAESAGVLLSKTGDAHSARKVAGLVKHARRLLRTARRATKRDRTLSADCRATVLAGLDAAIRDTADLLGR
jgi:hypothetical protein